MRLARVDDALAHEEIHGARKAQVLHQQKVPALVGQQREPEGGAAEARRGGGDAEVAGQRQREPGLDGDPVDRRDRQLVEVADGPVERLRDRAQPAVGADGAVVPRRQRRHETGIVGVGGPIPLEVVAGGERAPLADEHGHPHRVVHLDLRHRLDQVALHRRRHAVQALGRVERDPRHARLLDVNGEAAERPRIHVCLPLPCLARTAEV